MLAPARALSHNSPPLLSRYQQDSPIGALPGLRRPVACTRQAEITLLNFNGRRSLTIMSPSIYRHGSVGAVPTEIRFTHRLSGVGDESARVNAGYDPWKQALSTRKLATGASPQQWMFCCFKNLTRVEHCLSRRRPRVRVPSTPPTICNTATYIERFVVLTSGNQPEVERIRAKKRSNLERSCVYRVPHRAC
jgi:hypothetical protein